MILPPARIGVIGGGQLGMMTVREAQRMGFQSIIWDPDPACPASRLADMLLTAPFSDSAAADTLAEQADVVTYEFENIDPQLVESVQSRREVFPGAEILRIARHRRKEKETLQLAGFPLVPFQAARTRKEFEQAVEKMGYPVVAKTATAGYDGKGQTIIKNTKDLAAFFAGQRGDFPEFVVEKFLPLRQEVSVIAVRGRDGQVFTFPVIENEHRDNILHSSRVPARISSELNRQAVRLGVSIMEYFGIVGVLCIEMFVTGEGVILVNELAPRPHNSGHFSLDACSISQFEALVRSVCGLPMQEPTLLSPCAMVNLLGKHLERLDIAALQAIPGAKLHLYGKKRLEPKRKMGHVTVTATSLDEAEEKITRIEALIGEGSRMSDTPGSRTSVRVH